VPTPNCNCSATTALPSPRYIRGDGVQFNATYRGDAWREIFPKTLDLAAGDYSIRFKLNNLKWKTLHVYIRKDEKERLLLN